MTNTKILLLLSGLFFLRSVAFAQSLSGIVKDAKGIAVHGANVYLLNTNLSTSTNANGGFNIKNIPAGNYTVKVSAVGYATLTKIINVTNAASVNFTLINADKQLGEVFVTAQKQDEESQKLPMSISVITAKQVDDDKIWNIKDITGLVPNLYAANPGDNRNVTSVRGITTTSYDPAVATYIDGVNQFGLDTYIAQLLDVDRIEILRGPQGTLYGRNATGGVINIITKQPTNETTGFAGVDIGNYDQQRYSFGLRTPIIKDKLFLGVAGLFSNFGGFYTNSFNNTKFDKQHYFLGNYYLKFLANSKLSFTLNVKNDINRNNGPFTLVSSAQQALATPFVVDQNATTTMVDNTLNASLSANYTGSAFNFTSQSSYQKNYRYYKQPIDGDFSPIDGISLINNYGPDWNIVQTGIQEFRFSSPTTSTSHLKWTAGAYGFFNYSPTKVGTHFGSDAQMVGSTVSNFTSININTSTNYGMAFYGQVTYVFTPEFDVTAGLRYDYEHKKEFINGAYQPDGQAPVVTRTDTASTATFKALSPKVTAAWHLTPNNNLYAAYNRGFRAGGISELGSDPSQPPLYNYKPEYSDNYEAGTKNTFLDKRIRLNADVFYTRVNNAQVPTLLLPDAITVTQNAGKLTSYGAEAEFAATPVEGLEIDYNFGYTHARYTSLNIPVNDSVVNFKGNHQVFTPNITSTLLVQYAYGLGSSKKVKLVAHGEWHYLGDQYFDLANTIEQKAYNTFNARLGVSTKRFDVFLWGSNIFNKHYVDYAYDFGAAHLGNPRTFGLSVKTIF
ncbi:iron complex outermembrane recepter protein [Mucilaginibacter mallensis]|uniref:Iron complex outermembrane recepter protein n=1 Tax=Mucilaginibacter mallensis TaxID=652787 RepID=A0A1H1SLA7_MUCMA|nr:TonB-dependent receptor [Mucilaginibacter mallensis]SDS48767.1 iron complex outermembrane recepter protein [Mucilaginibacter mallensis]